MNKHIILETDTFHESFPVEISKKVKLEIQSIKDLNKYNKKAVSVWNDALNTYLELLSQRAVAWDYAGQQFPLPNGTLCMYADGFYIGYTVKNNLYGAYVYVFMIKYQLNRYGLKRPEGINENKSPKPIIETYILHLIRESVRTALMEHLNRTEVNESRQMGKPNAIRLTETQLRQVIAECVRKCIRRTT